MATTKLGLIFEIAAHPEKAIEALRDFDEAGAQSMDDVTKHMRKTKSATQDLTGFIDDHLIFSVDEFIRLGREALNAATSAAEFGEQVHNLSEATGIGAEQISGLIFAFKESGEEVTALSRGLRELARNLSPVASAGSEAGKALVAMGLSAYDAHGYMKNEFEIVLELADAFHKMKDGTEKAALAAAILGTRVAEQWIPILDRGRQGILLMISAAEHLGVTLTDKDAASLEQMSEQLKLVDARVEGLKLRLSEHLVPSLLELAQILTLNGDEWRIWGKGALVAVHNVALELDRLGQYIPLVGSFFRGQIKENAQIILELQTQAAMIQQHIDAIVKAFEAGQQGLLNPPHFAGFGKAAKTFSDTLASMVTREKEQLQSFSDSLQPDLRQIDLAYQRQVHAALKAIEADRLLLTRKKITLAEERREEQEYTDFLATAIKVRDAKWNEELDKTQANIEKISAHIAEERRKAHERLGAELMKGAPQGPQANVFGAQMSGLNNAMLQSALAAVPAVTRETAAVESLKNALLGLPPVLTDIAQKHQLMTAMSNKFSDAMGQNIAQAIVYGASIKQAMERALKATIESIAAKSIVQAIYSTALGFLLLAEFDFPAAAQAFEAAAVFGAVGGAAAAVGAAIPGGSRGSGGRQVAPRYSAGGGGHEEGSRAGGYGGALGAAQAYQPPSGGGNLTVAIMGDEEAGTWLATTLNRAVTQQGVQLVSTGSQRGAPVGH